MVNSLEPFKCLFMKQLFTIMLFLGIAGAASAQRISISSGPEVRMGYHSRQGYGNFDKEKRIRDVNREMDLRVFEVQADHFLTARQKRKMIKYLNRDRKKRIREISRWH